MFGFSQLCGLGTHRPGGTIVANGALTVGRCTRCNREIIRQGDGGWRTTPPHSRVVWREPDVHDMTWPRQDWS